MTKPNNDVATSVQSVVHTPGPWMCQRMDCQTDKHTFNSEVVAMDGTEVVSIVREPDAHLIAAAPGLLDACCKAEVMLDRIGIMEVNGEVRLLVDELRSAIYKATNWVV